MIFVFMYVCVTVSQVDCFFKLTISTYSSKLNKCGRTVDTVRQYVLCVLPFAKEYGYRVVFFSLYSPHWITNNLNCREGVFSSLYSLVNVLSALLVFVRNLGERAWVLSLVVWQDFHPHQHNRSRFGELYMNQSVHFLSLFICFVSLGGVLFCCTQCVTQLVL